MGDSLSIKSWVWFAITLTFLIYLGLTASGVCYNDMRWPGKLEYVDRVLFDDTKLEQDQKRNMAQDIYLSEYPYFCKVDDTPFGLSSVEMLLNLIAGKMFYEVECIYIKKDNDGEDVSVKKYYWRSSTVNACAKRVVDFTGSEATDTEYQGFLKRGREFWANKIN